jgi:hypothetical protein
MRANVWVGLIAIALTAGCGGARGGEGAAPKTLPERVLVLPFEDLSGSGDPSVAAEVTGLFTAELRLSRFGTMGPGEAADLDPAIADVVPSRLDADVAAALGRATGCEAIVIGAVTAYRRGGPLGGDRVALRARAVEARTGRPIGGASFSSDALKSSTLYRGIDQLMRHAVGEIVERLAREAQ